MSTHAPSLSVIISTYNWSSVLPYSIGSALRQTFADIEVLVVGDGCTDDSQAVVESIGDLRVRWINLPANTGHQSEPNNEGLRQAQGELIAYLGHDDLWLPHHLSCCIAAINSGADLAFSLVGMVCPERHCMEPAPTSVIYKPGISIPPSAVVHRRSTTILIGGWRDYRELVIDPDADLWSRAHKSGQQFVLVPRLTVIKFPASQRRDVYKTRPHHEQAMWFERIHEEADLEAVEAAKMLATATESLSGYQQQTSYLDLLRNLLKETAVRVRRRADKQLAPALSKKPGERIEARRQFKGLERDS